MGQSGTQAESQEGKTNRSDPDVAARLTCFDDVKV